MESIIKITNSTNQMETKNLSRSEKETLYLDKTTKLSTLLGGGGSTFSQDLIKQWDDKKLDKALQDVERQLKSEESLI